MKLLNYDAKTLILENVKPAEKQPVPEKITMAQYNYLCKLIRRKKISRQFFQFLLKEIFEETDWRKLTYRQMYFLIHILINYDYKR